MPEYESELSKLVDQLNRAATSAKSNGKRSLDQLLEVALRSTASDIILVAGSPVMLRVNGALTPDTAPPLTADDIRGILLPLLAPTQLEELHKQRSLDFCFVRGSIGRFRANFHHQLSLAILAIISQQLLPASNGAGRYPAVEVLVATGATRNLIRRGDDHQLRASIETGRADGMMTMEQSLVELFRAGRISRETAFAHCYHPDDLRRHMEN
ncbi:hypothetical protein [Granulicella sp. L60]|uniref:hypothetical protein n=1 Tax=Granulicella sp. L60 TaxID=1641866 RepID=UPI00131AF552|nr:hypothetical protein [Granulicella sp. L60]